MPGRARARAEFSSFYCLNTASITAHLADVTTDLPNARALMLLMSQNK